LPVGGREKQPPDQAECRQPRPGRREPWQQGAREAQKAPGVGETVQGTARISPSISPAGGRGYNGTRVHPGNLSYGGGGLKQAPLA
jgi:hypothetical protein